MNGELHDDDREERRNQVLLDFVESLEAGRQTDRGRLLEQHPDLREDLEIFLASHDEVARLASPLRGATWSGDSSGILGRRSEPSHGLGEIGDFRLLREVGRGGMGIVYEAEQLSLRRRVALKVLPFVAAIDPRRLQRFRTEALAAAQMRHEKIVPVHAVGCERGVHYYAMQFIDGQSLAALIEEIRRLRDSQAWTPPLPHQTSNDPTSSPFDQGHHCEARSEEAARVASTISREWCSESRRYFERVAELGRQAALALEHAHQAGIVHRDVKPSNLLLDLDGQLWIADFGLAQVTGDAGLTLTGELLGTIRYASPEQLLARRGIVDHRSDIYSLGATLYELLTLRPPFDGRDRNALIRQITDEDPRPPRSLAPSIPTELETLVLKALRKEPADRYATARELAEDLQRFLDGGPILARRPTASERLRAWSRRHPTIVGSSVAMLMLLSAASLVSTAIVRREQAKTLAEQGKAEAAYRREYQRAEEAEARFRLARRAVDELIRASEEELAHRPGMAGLRTRLLGAALVYYREFIAERGSDPDAQAELRDTSRRVETILADLAVLRGAGQLLLLVQPAALDDLQLDEGQRARVAELSNRAAARWMDAFGDPNRLSPLAERARIALEQARANEQEIDAILSPSQRARLRQIALQAEGPAAFRDLEVVEALGLSPQQRGQIRAIEEATLFRALRESPPWEALATADRRSLGRILAVLTPEQSRRWKDLAGEPVRGPLSPFPGPFRPHRESKRASR